MGFKDKMTKYYSDAYMNKYGDRMTSVSGTVLSVKTETKSFLGIFNRLNVWLVVNKVIVMGNKGEKGKANSEVVIASNIANLTTRKDLHPFDHSQIKKARQQATKMRTR